MLNKTVTAAILFATSVGAHAMPVYQYSTTDLGADVSASGGVNPAGGDIQTLDTTYDQGTGDFTWDYTVEGPSASKPHNGFWLVLSDGPNPKGSAENEYAILYGDLDAGLVSAFVYSGLNNANSFNSPGDFIQIFENSISVTPAVMGTTQSVSVALNTNIINAHLTDPEWQGLQFDDEVGIWFHPTAGYNFGYTANVLTSFSGGNGASAGWYDTNSPITTTQVPEPASWALLMIGGVGFAAFRRRKLINA